MESRTFMTVDDVAEEMSVSKSYAYKVVKQLNTKTMPQERGVWCSVLPIGRVSGSRHKREVSHKKGSTDVGA